MLAIQKNGKLQDLMSAMPRPQNSGQMRLSDLANPMALTGTFQPQQAQGFMQQQMPEGGSTSSILERLMRGRGMMQPPPTMSTAMQRLQGLQFGNQWKY